MSYEIKIQNFEGPLDLLLHLIKQNEMDIAELQIHEITHQYLEIIDQMKQLNLDVAGEFLLMAATLLHIKSKTLLPIPEDEEGEEEDDPRAELVRRLLEYQKYKYAAESLEEFPLLGRDTFIRRYELPEAAPEEDAGLESVGLYELAAAFQQLLTSLPTETVHEVMSEQLSVTDRINHILSQLSSQPSMGFSELFGGTPTRQEVVVSFLAMLELVKMRLVKLVQAASMGPIWVQAAVDLSGDDISQIQEDHLGYH